MTAKLTAVVNYILREFSQGSEAAEDASKLGGRGVRSGEGSALLEGDTTREADKIRPSLRRVLN